jgi:glycosyltransferase involved in cell wall biosynthesis
VRVCYFGTYRAEYSRNRIMIEGLRRNGVEVIECHEPLWLGIEDRVQVATGGWIRPSFWLRVARVYSILLRKYWDIGDYDVMVLGYPGQLDVPLARLLTRLKGKPLVLDVFMSLYLIAQERGLTQRSPFTARLIYLVEKTACLLPDLLILDTNEYVNWFNKIYKIPIDRFSLIPTGADDRIFRPITLERSDGLFRVLYYGSFIPNHGIQYIIEAARLLSDEPDIHFELIGNGPEKSMAVALACRYNLTNVTFEDWMDQEELVRRAANADVILGAFGTTPQSLMTVQNKIYEGLAMGKPVITGDGPAVRTQMIHGEHVYLCERANPQSLAEAIKVLKKNPELRRSIGAKGYNLYREKFAPSVLGFRFLKYISSLL